MNGVVKKIVGDKGFGFIKGEDGKEYFFHTSALKNCRFADLSEGRDVTFEEVDSAKGLRAEDVYA